MVNKHVNCVLIGCGQQMRNNLFPFLQRLNCHTVVACVDPNEMLAQELATRTGAQQWVRDVRDLDLTGIDAAIVATPPYPSFQITKYLIQNRIACFVEKPGAPSTSALDALWCEAQKYGVYVQIGFNFRYTEALAHLYRLSRAQRQGPHYLTIDFLSRHPSLPQWGVPHTIDAWFRHNGVHAFDLAQWLIGAPVEVVQAHLVAQDEHKFLSTVLLHHVNGAVSVLRVGNQTKQFIIRVDVHGKDGSRYYMPSLEKVYLDLDAGQSSGAQLFITKNLDHGWSRSGFGPELEDFFDVVYRGKQPELAAPALGDAYKASQVCDQVLACLPSYRTPCYEQFTEREIARMNA